MWQRKRKRAVGLCTLCQTICFGCISSQPQFIVRKPRLRSFVIHPTSNSRRPWLLTHSQACAQSTIACSPAGPLLLWKSLQESRICRTQLWIRRIRVRYKSPIGFQMKFIEWMNMCKKHYRKSALSHCLGPENNSCPQVFHFL